MKQTQTDAAHNAARLLQSVALSHLSKKLRQECLDASHALYKEFGEPPEPVTSAGRVIGRNQ